VTAERRLLLVGVDAATLDLIRPWTERGDLPVMGRLMEAGAFGRLRSVPNMVSPAAWSSFATGCNPGMHGVFSFTERVPGSYEERYTNGASRVGTPFWVLLSRSGIPCTVVDVPWTYPADPIDGVMISGMDAPGSHAARFIHPPELAADLRRRFDPLLGTGWNDGGIGDMVRLGKFDTARAFLEQRVAARTELCRHLMGRYPADMFCVVHTEVDRIQHFFWEFIDPRMPGFSTSEGRRQRDGILRLYQKVDQSIGELLEAFGPANVMIMSDHGAGASPGRQDAWIRLVLEEMGLSVPREPRGALRRISRAGVAHLYRLIAPRIPRGAKWAVARRAPAAARAIAAAAADQHDWSRTRAYCAGASGEVWLNVRGRDPEGLVEPGADYDRTRQRIRDVCMGLRDAQTGDRVVEAVSFREEIYDGPFVDRAPDLLILFRDVVVDGITMNNKVLRLPPSAGLPKDISNGAHRPDGIVILAGAGVPQGMEVSGARLLDIAPTVLHWMGRPVPVSMDGRVLAQAFGPEYRAVHPVKTTDGAGETAAREDSSYTGEEAAAVMERLRKLGYM
jgi:predicted AlkP superfamily phosphohydrolase/phosphomutase